MTDAREALARLVRTLDAKSAEDQERLGRYWDRGLADGDVQEDVYRRTDAILTAGWTPPGERVKPSEDDQWWESLVEAPCDQGHRVFIDDGDGGVYACPVCSPPVERVKPTLEQVVDALAAQPPGSAEWTSSRLMQTAHAVLALLPGRSEAEVKAEALREAAPGCNCEDDYAWLNDRADRIEKEADRG